jgi:hypothetical protein
MSFNARVSYPTHTVIVIADIAGRSTAAPDRRRAFVVSRRRTLAALHS